MSTSQNELSKQKYIALTTHRKDGTQSTVPVWVVDLGDGCVGFTTTTDTLKVKRIRNDPRVAAQPCTMRGEVLDGSTESSGTAEVLLGADGQQIRAAVAKKYGWQHSLIGVGEKVKGIFKSDDIEQCSIRVTLD